MKAQPGAEQVTLPPPAALIRTDCDELRNLSLHIVNWQRCARANFHDTPFTGNSLNRIRQLFCEVGVKRLEDFDLLARPAAVPHPVIRNAQA